MLFIVSNTRGFTIETTNGSLGTVGDFLFEDTTWKIRWMVVDTQWLAGRKVLIHPSSIGHIDSERRELNVSLTRAQVENSTDIERDLPVSQQMRNEYYGQFDGPHGGEPGAPPSGRPDVHRDQGFADLAGDDGDPHLRSVAEVTGYHVRACDGAIGHVENLLAESSDYGVRYLIVDTRNWWLGQHVLISANAVKSIDWFNRRIELNISVDEVKSSPTWDLASEVDQARRQRALGSFRA